MARILGGSTPFGELRGKLGSMIFSRNSATAYVKGYAKPVNPKTTAQLNARANFTQARGGYSLLNAVQKADWDTYAKNYYVSRKQGAVTGTHTGYNAYTALRNNIAQLMNLPVATIPSIDGESATITPIPVALPTDAPLGALSPTLSGGEYTYNGILNTNVLLSPAGQMTITTQIDTTPVTTGPPLPPPLPQPGPTPSANPEISDGNRVEVCYLLYLSEPFQRVGDFINKKEVILGGATEFGQFSTSQPVMTDEIELNLIIPALRMGSYKTGYSKGKRLLITCYMMNRYGQQARIGEEIVIIA